MDTRSSTKLTGLVEYPLSQSASKPRVGIICDLTEEHWPSMDLVGDMLSHYLGTEHSDEIAVEQLRPPMRRRLSRVPLPGAARAARNADRVFNRFIDYPRWLRRQADRFDLFHIVDHSYSQLINVLPPDRTIVTCHDLDTFRCLIEPSRDPRPRWFRSMAKKTLNGFRRAAHVIAVSHYTRAELLRQDWFQEDRISVIHSGVHPTFCQAPDPASELAVNRLFGGGPSPPFYLLHAGSTVPRKRIDVLLRVFAAIAPQFPELRLVKAGGRLTDSQRALAQSLGVRERVIAASDVNRDILAALYRNATLLLQTSEAEGFGLPVIEALACACPVLASDIPALREAGGSAAEYRPVGDVAAWSDSVARLLCERTLSPEGWVRRLNLGLRHAAQFSWSETARQTAAVYTGLRDAHRRTTAGRGSRPHV
jgi:glycosyltransferase involved in cell wall biosynthesis